MRSVMDSGITDNSICIYKNICIYIYGHLPKDYLEAENTVIDSTYSSYG